MRERAWVSGLYAICMLTACPEGSPPTTDGGRVEAMGDAAPDPEIDASADSSVGDASPPPAQVCDDDEPVCQVVQGFAPILMEVCATRFDCCNDPKERSWLFGPPINTVASCVSTLADLIKNGFTPPFIELPTPLVDIVRDLTDPRLRLEINAAGVRACANQIRSASSCASSGSISSDRCTPRLEVSDACAPKHLVIGRQELSEPCLPNDKVEECAPGTACHRIGPPPEEVFCRCDPVFGCQPCEKPNPRVTVGACAPQAAVGDACMGDADCDALFCNPESGQCQARSKLGEPCAYASETLGDLTTKLDCEAPLTCDPVRNVCVAACSENAVCYNNATCPMGLVCDLTALLDRVPAGTVLTTGVCVPPKPDGSTCRNYRTADSLGFEELENACESGVCETASEVTGTCAPAPPVDNGPSCLVASFRDARQEDVVVDCPDSMICDRRRSLQESIEGWPDYERFACSLRADLGQYCLTGSYGGCKPDFYCDANGLCAQRNTISASACVKDEQCMDGERCPQASLVCAPYALPGERCDTDTSCGPGYECDVNQECTSIVGLGEACTSTGAACVKEAFCNAGPDGTGVCEKRRELGAPCDRSTSDQCGPGRACQLNTGVYLCGTARGEILCDGMN